LLVYGICLLRAGVEKKRDFGWLVLRLFFCSGATALVYEVVWSKYLSQMFGSTIQAQTVVLAVFMGGLALGIDFLVERRTNCAHPSGCMA
jgi:hypothetical protein